MFRPPDHFAIGTNVAVITGAIHGTRFTVTFAVVKSVNFLETEDGTTVTYQVLPHNDVRFSPTRSDVIVEMSGYPSLDADRLGAALLKRAEPQKPAEPPVVPPAEPEAPATGGSGSGDPPF